MLTFNFYLFEPGHADVWNRMYADNHGYKFGSEDHRHAMLMIERHWMKNPTMSWEDLVHKMALMYAAFVTFKCDSDANPISSVECTPGKNQDGIDLFQMKVLFGTSSIINNVVYEMGMYPHPSTIEPPSCEATDVHAWLRILNWYFATFRYQGAAPSRDPLCSQASAKGIPWYQYCNGVITEIAEVGDIEFNAYPSRFPAVAARARSKICDQYIYEIVTVIVNTHGDIIRKMAGVCGFCTGELPCVECGKITMSVLKKSGIQYIFGDGFPRLGTATDPMIGTSPLLIPFVSVDTPTGHAPAFVYRDHTVRYQNLE